MASTGSKTVTVSLTVSVKNPSNVEEAKRVIQITDTQDQATQLFPQNIAPSTVNAQLALGGVTQAKWILLEIDQEVTIKVNQNTDTGFPAKGVVLLQSESGITNVFVTTGANATCVNFIAVGT